MNEEEQKLLNDLLEKENADSTYSDMDAFVIGFRLTALIMVEVFHDKDDLLHDKEQYLRHMLQHPFRGALCLRKMIDDLIYEESPPCRGFWVV